MAVTAGYELLLQLSRNFLQEVVNSERIRADAALPRTVLLIDPANPPSLGPLLVEDAHLNLETLSVEVELDPVGNRLRLVTSAAEVQLKFADRSATRHLLRRGEDDLGTRSPPGVSSSIGLRLAACCPNDR